MKHNHKQSTYGQSVRKNGSSRKSLLKSIFGDFYFWTNGRMYCHCCFKKNGHLRRGHDEETSFAMED